MGFPDFPLLMKMVVVAAVFLWSLPGDKWSLLKFSVFLECLFYGPLAKEGRFLGGFFGSVPIGVSSLPDSAVPGLEYLRRNQKAKKPRTHQHVFLQGPNSLAFLTSLYFSESSCVYFTYNVQGVLALLRRWGVGLWGIISGTSMVRGGDSGGGCGVGTPSSMI